MRALQTISLRCLLAASPISQSLTLQVPPGPTAQQQEPEAGRQEGERSYFIWRREADYTTSHSTLSPVAYSLQHDCTLLKVPYHLPKHCHYLGTNCSGTESVGTGTVLLYTAQRVLFESWGVQRCRRNGPQSSCGFALAHSLECSGNVTQMHCKRKNLKCHQWLLL